LEAGQYVEGEIHNTVSWENDVLIVGATGYIGAPLFRLAMLSCQVQGTSTIGSNQLISFQLDAPDTFDYGLIKDLEVVLVTAGISAPDACARDHDRAWAINVTGTSKFIASVMARGGRVLFFSSDTVYGERNDTIDERAVCNPVGEYAEMKYDVEKRFLGNPLFKAIRLSYVFSQEDKFTKYVAGCAERGEVAEIFHPFYRAVICRDDVLEGAIALAIRWNEFPQHVINFGGPEILARTEFAKILQDTVCSNLIFHVTEPDADFFKNRPRVIRMASPVLSILLGRSARTLRETVTREFDFSRGKHIA